MSCGGTWRWRCSRRWRCSCRGNSAGRPIAFAAVPAGIRPEWYFLAMFQTLKLIPSHIFGLESEMLGVMGFNVAALFLLLGVPFIDRKAAAGVRVES